MPGYSKIFKRLIIVALSFSSMSAFCQKTVEWLPSKAIFPMLRNDLYETQPYAGVFYLNAPDSGCNGAFFPVNLAFRKPVFEWQMGQWQSQLSFGAGAYSQFEVGRNGRNEYQAGMLNVDFRALGFLYLRNNGRAFRIRYFHQSSHLADDYMLRNNFFRVNNSKGNYEQLDITFLQSLGAVEPYLGVGYILSPNAFRKRFSLQIGLQSAITQERNVLPSYGLHVDILEENNFVPNLHGSAGISINQFMPASIIFQMDLFYGKMPYSTIEMGQIFWLGLSTIIGF